VSAESAGKLTVDVDTGVYGHRITMEDHDAADLARFRRMAVVVAFEDRLPHVTTALALSGSAAQARIHRFPADADFFERIHIRADTRDEACTVLADVVREKALATLRGPGYRLQEVKFGNWPVSGTVDGASVAHGKPVSWTPPQVEAGFIGFTGADGVDARLSWEDAARDPGWCKLDWVIADPHHRGVANVSNLLDPTWEAPDGTITPLDGFLDPDFREVYLATDSFRSLSRPAPETGADLVADYVERLTDEVYRYTVTEPNYGRAARRMYNIFRLTGRHPEAAYLRELFDAPVTALSQLAVLLRAPDEAADAGDSFETDATVVQVDQLIMSAIAALEGDAEVEIVRRLFRLRDAVGQPGRRGRRDVATAHDDAMRAVNEHLERRLRAVPTIKAYLDSLAATRHASTR
jgi:hypothetical protein